MTLLVVSSMAQTTRPASSLPQPGAEVEVADWLSKALHAVPLNTLEVSPPVALRAAHSTRPPPSDQPLPGYALHLHPPACTTKGLPG